MDQDLHFWQGLDTTSTDEIAFSHTPRTSLLTLSFTSPYKATRFFMLLLLLVAAFLVRFP